MSLWSCKLPKMDELDAFIAVSEGCLSQGRSDAWGWEGGTWTPTTPVSDTVFSSRVTQASEAEAGRGGAAWLARPTEGKLISRPVQRF